MRRATSDEGLLESLLGEGYDFFTGVPDSGLKRFIADVWELPPEQHVPATWEAEAVGIAAGHLDVESALTARRLGHAIRRRVVKRWNARRPPAVATQDQCSRRHQPISAAIPLGHSGLPAPCRI